MSASRPAPAAVDQDRLARVRGTTLVVLAVLACGLAGLAAALLGGASEGGERYVLVAAGAVVLALAAAVVAVLDLRRLPARGEGAAAAGAAWVVSGASTLGVFVTLLALPVPAGEAAPHALTGGALLLLGAAVTLFAISAWSSARTVRRSLT